jgi:hypothetical protein
MKLKHIYWFAYYNLDEPSVRYRALYPLQHLKSRHSVSYTIIYSGYNLGTILKFIHAYCSVLFFRRSNSIIVFQKIYTKGIYATALKLLLRLRSSYTFYDIDDAEYIRRPDETINFFIKHCTGYLAGSETLVQYAHQLNRNACLLSSPVIDHQVHKSKLNEVFTIGWIGYYGAHQESLKQLFFPALLELDFPVRLKLLGVGSQAQLTDIQAFSALNQIFKWMRHWI